MRSALVLTMESVFELLRRLSPAALVLRAIVVATAVDVLLLAFILLRRAYRKRYFAKRDAKVFEFRRNWEALLSGRIAFETWRSKSFERRIVEEIALDAFESASPEESAKLLRFLRASGLIEKRIFEARHHVGWRRQRALVALGRTRAPEGIPALSEGLRDRVLETRLAALRGLERVASPESGLEILNWMMEAGLRVPVVPLQSALIQCCAERPQIVLPYLEHTEAATREIVGRVLGEIATPSLGPKLLPFVDDKLPELRAAVARALAQTEPKLAVDVLTDLTHDKVWFVRLRAVVSLGQLSHPSAIDPLLSGLCDSNRLVRLRAAEALIGFIRERLMIFERVVASHDKYGLYAYLAALDNAGLQKVLEAEVRLTYTLPEHSRQRLLEVLRVGSFPAKQFASEPLAAKGAGASS